MTGQGGFGSCSNCVCINVACLRCAIPQNTVGYVAADMSHFTEFFRLMVGLNFSQRVSAVATVVAPCSFLFSLL